jgi:hypothetical protein
MVPRCKCSAMNFSISLISSWGSLSSLPANDFGVFGSSSIAWSHTVLLGSHWDFCSLNTFVWQWNSSGTLVRSVSSGCSRWTVALHRKYLSFRAGRRTFLILGTKVAFCTFGTLSTMGSWKWSIHPFFQSILGWVTVNHGYPRITLCSPRSDRKNHSVVVFCPVQTFRLV